MNVNENKKVKSKLFSWKVKLGGANVGFPISMLFINSQKITIHFNFCTYSFPSDRVISLKKNKKGVQILHNIDDYPADIFIGSWETSDEILQKIKELDIIYS